MDRNKVLELAREAELARQFALEVPFVVDRLERFAALIERELRGDAEPVAWINKDGCIVGNDEGGAARPLYLHPAPAVVRQLVEALQGMFNIAIDSQGVAGYHLNGEIAEWDDFEEIDKVKAALAAAKEAGL